MPSRLAVNQAARTTNRVRVVLEYLAGTNPSKHIVNSQSKCLLFHRVQGVRPEQDNLSFRESTKQWGSTPRLV